MIVPDKKIACIPLLPTDDSVAEFDMDIVSFLRPLQNDHKRHWFTSHFYKCLPLTIGNMQGFVFSLPFGLEVFWNGGIQSDDMKLTPYNFDEKLKKMNHVHLTSEFGHGILTAHFPLMLKTPPGVNLMTIAPPNYPLPGISPMTGVVETDNLRFTFTLNFKIDLPNTLIKIEKDYPIMGILPIPRYFCDSFELVNAYDILDKDEIEEERQVYLEQAKRRDEQNMTGLSSDLLYYKGMDIRKNQFKDHQMPKKF